jgi:hypothetical protein
VAAVVVAVMIPDPAIIQMAVQVLLLFHTKNKN